VAAGMHGEHGDVARERGAARRPAGSRSLSVIVPDIGPAKRLIAEGTALRYRAPELSMVFGERAAALAEAAGSEQLWADAEALAVSARMRLGQRASVVNRAVVVLRTAEAEAQPELAAQMRVELALCARSVGVPLTGLAALRPVLGDPDISPECRTLAMVQLVGCMAPLGRRKVLERALSEAEDLATTEVDLPAVDRTLLRAIICSRSAANQRRYGDLAMSIEYARQGLELLDGLGAGAADGVQLRARLVLELVCALLDRGSAKEAAELAIPVLAEPARASAMGPLAWLRLAVATRIRLPAGEAEAAGVLVRDALHGALRHDLQAVTARLWLELAHIEEAVGRPAEAVRCLREARRNEHTYSRTRRQALGLLIGEFGRGEQHVVDIPQPASRPRRSPQDVPPQRRERKPSDVATATASAPTAAPAPTPTEPTVRKPEVAQPATRDPEVAKPPTRGLAGAEPANAASEPTGSAPAAEGPKHAGQQPSVVAPRHRAGGTADARSVLERLGVAVSSGGRRRAPEHSAGEPPAAQVAGAEAAAPEPAGSEPAGSESSQNEPPRTQPSASDPPKTEPPKTEPPKTEPPKTEPPKTEPSASESPPRPKLSPPMLPLLRPPREPLEPTAPAAAQPAEAQANGVRAEPTAAKPAMERPAGEKPAGEKSPSEEPTADEPAEPLRLDSLLAVFSNWTDDDAKPGVVEPRVRPRRHERPAEVKPLAANGRKVNGDDAAGRHRGAE
jgi:hypothetical protein